MQFMADFLLEPSAKQADTTRKVSTATARDANSPSFSGVYAQQQQAREQAVKQETLSTRAKNQPIAQVAERPARASNEPETKAKQPERPKSEAGKAAKISQEVDSHAGNSLPEAETQETDDSLVAQMDPLLLHVMRTVQLETTDELALEAELEGEAVDDELLETAPLAGLFGFVSNTEIKAETKPTATPALAAGQHSTEDAAEPVVELSLDSEEVLELADGVEPELFATAKTDVKPDMAQLVAQMAAQDKSDARAPQSAAAIETKLGVDGTAMRTDALMRSEAVQAATATRQIPSGPLSMQQPGWSKELTDKVMWMSSQNLKTADIQLNPAELGRLDIRIQMTGEQTQVSFVSAHAGVRESLEGQAFRLREMLAQQGMQDVDVNVADQSQSEQHEQAREMRAASGRGEDASDMHMDDEAIHGESALPLMDNGHGGLHSYYV